METKIRNSRMKNYMCQPAENIIWLVFKHAGFQSLKQMESGRCLSLRTMCFSISNIVEKGTSTQGPPLLPLCGFQNLRFFDSGDKPITPLHRLDSLQTVLKDILVLMSHMKQSGMSHQRPGGRGGGGGVTLSSSHSAPSGMPFPVLASVAK